jgi:hypothetical protein
MRAQNTVDKVRVYLRAQQLTVFDATSGELLIQVLLESLLGKALNLPVIFAFTQICL